MKKQITGFFLFVLLVSSFAVNGHAVQEKPDYEKYGRMAIAVVTADYPGAQVKDYEYLGRKNVSESVVADSFRFKVEDKGKSFNVIVTVTHDLTEEKLVTLTVKREE